MRSILFFGLLLGMRHALEADHLAAVASMAAGRRDRVSTILRGATWGAGHTLALLLAGGLSLGLGLTIPTGPWTERAVGFMLVALGANVLFRIRRDRVHVHVHQHHDGVVHLHAHRHAAADRSVPDHHHHHRHGFELRAAGVGMVHGLAGSGALLLVVASAMTSRWLGLAYVAIIGLGSIAGMALMSAAIAVPLDLSARRLAGTYFALEILIALGTIAIGVRLMG
jgi:hypothetical protein